MQSLESLRLSRPADFWRLLRRPPTSMRVSPERLFHHYHALLESPTPVGAPEECLPFVHSPAQDFTVEEVTAAIHSLK
jgi:hypothetical protein